MMVRGYNFAPLFLPATAGMSRTLLKRAAVNPAVTGTLTRNGMCDQLRLHGQRRQGTENNQQIDRCQNQRSNVALRLFHATPEETCSSLN